MMSSRIVGVGLLACLTACLSACSERNADWKTVYPVTGEIYVDGEPAEGVAVEFHPENGMDQDQPSVTSAKSDAEGKFAASTYESGDGAPEGEYVLTFTLGKLNKLAMAYEGDAFQGRYKDPEKSEFKVSVSSDTAPVDLGRIELSTK